MKSCNDDDAERTNDVRQLVNDEGYLLRQDVRATAHVSQPSEELGLGGLANIRVGEASRDVADAHGDFALVEGSGAGRGVVSVLVGDVRIAREVVGMKAGAGLPVPPRRGRGVVPSVARRFPRKETARPQHLFRKIDVVGIEQTFLVPLIFGSLPSLLFLGRSFPILNRIFRHFEGRFDERPIQ